MSQRPLLFAAAMVVAASLPLSARADGVPEAAPWNYGTASIPSDVQCRRPPTPPMFGDQFQFGFNFGGQFNFNFGGQFGQFGAQFGGQFGQFGGQFNGGGAGFNGGNFNGGGGGGFNFGGGGGNFNGGGGGFNGGFNFQGGFNGGAPIAVARGPFKIAENDSPRPTDRVSLAWNYYDRVIGVVDVNRETLAVEKTFLGGNASVELRLPYFQNGAQGSEESELGDLTVLFKYAFVNTDQAVLSAGLAVTAPTSSIPNVIIVNPDGSVTQVHSTLLQPFVGYLWAPDDFFVHGFSSVTIPTDSRDGTILYNDVGIGYWVYRGEGFLRGVAPTVEAHLTTPLSNRGFPGFADSLDLTAGSYFYLGDRLSIGAAVGTPVTGPRLFSVEGMVHVNWRF